MTEFGFRLGNWRNLVAVVGGVLLATLMVPARKALLEKTGAAAGTRERLDPVARSPRSLKKP